MATPLRVLILEDTPADAELMVRHLQEAGFAPEWRRVESETDYLASLQSPPDVILADYRLPQFDGLRALRLAQERKLDVPFILVSGAMGEDLAVSALREGAADYILKDRLARLGQAVTQALGQRRLREEMRDAEVMLRESERRYRGLFEGVPVGLYRMTSTGQILDANSALIRMLGYPDREALMSVNAAVIYLDPLVREQGMTQLERQGILDCEAQLRRRDGTVIWVRDRARAVRDRFGRIAHCEGAMEEITDRKRTEAALKQSERRFRALIENSSDGVALLGADGSVLYVSPAIRRLLGYDTKERLGGNHFDLFYPDDLDRAKRALADLVRNPGGSASGEYRLRHKDGSWRWLETIETNLLAEPSVKAIVSNFRDITDRRQASEQIKNQIETLTALYGSAQQLAQSLDLHQLAGDVVRSCVESFGVRLAWLGRLGLDESLSLLAHFLPDSTLPREIVARWNDSSERPGAINRAIRASSPVVVDDMGEDVDSPQWQSSAQALGLQCAGVFPLVSRTRILGVLVLHGDRPGFFTPQRVEFLRAYAHYVAAALENARLFEDADRRLHQLQALRDIDVAISSSLDLRLTLNVLLENVVAQLQIDAAAVLLLNASMRTLEYGAGHGFRTPALQHTHLRLGEGHAGRAALEHLLVPVPNLAQEPGDFSRAPLLAAEGFVAYYAVPLAAKGQVKGVLELFHRSPLRPTREWLDYLDALAGEAAIAIDSAALFSDLQRSSAALAQAYDTTLEGWSRALDLRDKETEGHTQRVTEMTLRLAQAMGVPEADLVHMRRGALLHDIGKMGIPDSILLKPGPLSEEEWTIMRLHPVYAYELLSPIPYLRPALDIPYCHHEKWDGTGYPRGLRQVEIPLPARIFAVADVWDALRSDRPYRPAWTDDRAREYIREQAGTHFDPQAVDIFLHADNETH